MEPRRWRTLVVLATLVGAVLRFTALDFGLPDRFRPDEQYLVETAARLGGARGFDPHFAMYPAAQIYLIWTVAQVAQWTAGETWSVADATGRRRWYLTGRFVSAVQGTLTIPLAAALADAAAGSGGPAGALAAALTAGTFLPVRDSHFAVTDAGLTFWTVAACLALSPVIRRRRPRDSLVAGALVGVATATKYPAATLVLPLALAHLVGPRPPWWRSLGLLALAAMALGVTFFVTTPYILLDLDATRGVLWKRAYDLRTPGLLAPGSARWLIGEAMPAAVGWPLGALVLAALAWALVAGGALARILVTWLVLNGLPLAFGGLVFVRYLMPLVPVGLALLAAAVARLAAGRRYLAAVAFALPLCALVPSLLGAIAVDRLLLRTDTRTLAREWMEARLSSGTVVYAPALGKEVTPYALPEASGGVFRYAPATGELPGGAYVLVAEHPLHHAHPPDAALYARLRDATSLFDFNPFSATGGGRPPTWDPPDAFFVPLTGFGGVERPGPRLRLFRLAP